MEVTRQQPTIVIYGDIEDPKISVGDISLSYPPYELTILQITPHNGKWSGFRLLATREVETPLDERREETMWEATAQQA